MSISTSSVNNFAISPSNTEASLVQTSASEAKDAANSKSQEDSIALSQRALDYLRQDNPSLQAPDANTSDEDVKKYQQILETYKYGVQKADAITLSSNFQSYADIINDSEASDVQKLKAYSNYRAESTIANTSLSIYKSSDQDFKFDFLTRNSNFVRRINSGDVSSYYNQQRTDRFLSSNGRVDFQKDAANLIDTGSELTSLQQNVIAINLVSTNLMSAIINGNKSDIINNPEAQNIDSVPGFQYNKSRSIDINAAVAKAVSQSLQALSISKIGQSENTLDKSYRKNFTQQIQNFAQYALELSRK